VTKITFLFLGIIVFMAPTKPLVDQQISACSDIVGIPGSDTSQLTGTISSEERAKLWTQRRVFFCTPQTLTNDLTNGICDPRRIVCIVIDEAHRATANYAYTTAVEHISRYNSNFRILALSATPGTNARDIQNVITIHHFLTISVQSGTVMYTISH
jgi:ATP-dependent DNA helicase MPH1